MRLRLDATADELAGGSDRLLRALSDALVPHAPELADQLFKAQHEHSGLGVKDPVLEGLRDEFVDAYRRQMEAMNRDIAQVLDQSVREVAKSEDGDDA